MRIELTRQQVYETCEQTTSAPIRCLNSPGCEIRTHNAFANGFEPFHYTNSCNPGIFFIIRSWPDSNRRPPDRQSGLLATAYKTIKIRFSLVLRYFARFTSSISNLKSIDITSCRLQSALATVLYVVFCHCFTFWVEQNWHVFWTWRELNPLKLPCRDSD